MPRTTAAIPRSQNSNTDTSETLQSEYDREKIIDFLTPSERVRRRKRQELSGLERKPKMEQETPTISLYEKLLQERSRQHLLDKLGAISLSIFHPVRPSTKFAPFKQKTLRGNVTHLLLWGSMPCDHTALVGSYFDWFVLIATILACILNACLSDKICERRLHDFESGSGALWDGDTGILSTFYPFTKCRYESV